MAIETITVQYQQSSVTFKVDNEQINTDALLEMIHTRYLTESCFMLANEHDNIIHLALKMLAEKILMSGMKYHHCLNAFRQGYDMYTPALDGKHGIYLFGFRPIIVLFQDMEIVSEKSGINPC